MEVHGTLDLRDNDLVGAVFGIETNFPVNPRPGRFIMKDKVLFVCVELIGGIPVWVPLTKALNLLKYNQSTPALEWSIAHNLNTNAVIVQVYDADGNVVIPDNIHTVFNLVTITFATPLGGFALIQRGEEDGATPLVVAFQATFTNSDTWVINHNLGYNPVVNCYIGSDLVQPASLVHNSVNQATVTFSTPQTGSVRCI